MDEEKRKELMGDKDCEPCFERTGKHAPFEREIAGVKMCAMCLKGKTPTPDKPPNNFQVIPRRPVAPILTEAVTTSQDLINYMGQVMKQLATGEMDIKQADAICKAANVMLRVIEVRLKYQQMQQTP